jgi:hypothetical protein
MDSQSVKQLAEALEDRRWAAMLSGDADAFAEIASEELQYVHSSGVRDDRAAYLESIRSKATIYHSADWKVLTVIELGSSAFTAMGEVRMEALVSGIERKMHSHFMVVWRREKDVWRLVAHQTTLAKE